MFEAGKAVMRRLRESAYATRYFVGEGIDIGAGNDPLSNYQQQFPAMRSLYPWDVEDGDAQLMEGVENESYDFVHSSHCLEHMREPAMALGNWFRILRPGGHLVVLVPEEDMYEQGVWPSTYNPDHKHTFVLWKAMSWSPVSVSVLDLVRTLGPRADVVKVEALWPSFRFLAKRIDQTQTPIGECAIEFIVRKRHEREMAAGGLLTAEDAE